MIQDTIKKLNEKKDLSGQEAENAMKLIMEGSLEDGQIIEFLTGLRDKGETIGEITACARIMREKAIRISPKASHLVDTCGTGGDNKGTFNISTAAGFVAAGAGARVAKHGNKSVSSKCGSADVLGALGINIKLEPKKVEECIEKTGIGFMFAPLFHPAMKNVVNARKQIGTRTIFNILGPLTNPANVPSQVLGAFDVKLLKVMAEVLRNLGSRHAMVVNGQGLDEITTSGTTRIAELKKGNISKYEFNPEEHGIEKRELSELTGGDAKENAEIITRILKGEKGAKRDIVVLNAAAALVVSEVADDIEDGMKKAAESTDSGKAMEKLEKMRDFTNA